MWSLWQTWRQDWCPVDLIGAANQTTEVDLFPSSEEEDLVTVWKLILYSHSTFHSKAGSLIMIKALHPWQDKYNTGIVPWKVSADSRGGSYPSVEKIDAWFLDRSLAEGKVVQVVALNMNKSLVSGLFNLPTGWAKLSFFLYLMT